MPVEATVTNDEASVVVFDRIIEGGPEAEAGDYV